MNYPKPLSDRVIILPDAAQKNETKTGAFEIPDDLKDKPSHGIVKAVGIGFYAKETGVLIPMEVKEGDYVLFSKRSGNSIGVGGVEHILVKQDEIHLILNK